ncbi:MAG: cysteine--tRNA ligase [Christensenellaceae bacterium]|nr:cysteine--tRNA ligase [Christensenellaceae bacterium]
MKIFNSKSRKKEKFIPIEEGKVKIYSCGPTVYDFFHIGNARPFIVFDVLRRQFERLGYEVTFVQNFTDIDDKMINRANEEGITVKELADRYIKEYNIDANNLGIKPATYQPRATEHIDEIIELIKKLIEAGKAYQSGGDVYFSVESFENYGMLCGQCLEDLEAGARIEIDSYKKNPLDFVLWKAQKPGEPAWDSPFGKGRPGWHIECSAMSMAYLGDTFDIHCGGKDLLFPHHENEIAQSEGATGKTYVNYWMHNGFINIDNEKMSKSKGNFFTIRELSKKYDLEVIRMFMLLVHYRSPVNYSPELVEQANSSLQRLYTFRKNMEFLYNNSNNINPFNEAETEFENRLNNYVEQFDEAMCDDLNTADAISILFEIVKDSYLNLNEESNKNLINKTKNTVQNLADVLGILRKQEESIPDEIIKLADERQIARKQKDYKKADEIRNIIMELGYIIEDTPQGQKIIKK